MELIYFFFRKFVVSVSCLLLLNIFPLGSEHESFGVLSFSRKVRTVMVCSPYLFAFYVAPRINHYCWFLSGNFSFNLVLALPPNAFFCWLKFSTVICGFPERETPWSGRGGRLHSNSGIVGVPRQSDESRVSRGVGWKLATNSSLTWGSIF